METAARVLLIAFCAVLAKHLIEGGPAQGKRWLKYVLSGQTDTGGR